MPPVGLQAELKKYVDSNKVVVFSKSWCPYCKKVKGLFQSLGVEYLAIELDKTENEAAMQEALKDMTGQKTVPNVFVNKQHVGGCDDTLKANETGRLRELLGGGASSSQQNVSYDYDFLVIGGGSGGLAASKEAAGLGARTCVLDFVKPTPQGTTWGLGGTCVNVGCIPKKLMHQAALLGEAIKDSKKYGWSASENADHKWDELRDAVQNHIGSLNWGYRVALRDKAVTYMNAAGEFVDAHAVKTVDRKGKEKIVTAKNIMVAVGGRPRYPDIPGAKEYAITSDDLFSLPYNPGKTLCIGASYISLECAGFIKGFEQEVTVMVRSILLRGFDQQMADRLGGYMESTGINFVRECVPVKIEQLDAGSPGRYKVTGRYSDGTEYTDEFNTVLVAVGRDATTGPLHLDKAGVRTNPKNGKIIVNEREESNVSHITAVGDVIDGKPELTPVAIQAGKLLAHRIFAGAQTLTDYKMVPTTVFTPLEYGVIGYSEEDAAAKWGEDNVEVYHSNFQPLEYTVAGRAENDCYAKLVCLKTEKERVVGFHVLGPNAGEITQGYAVAMRMGATKADFDATIGIHPTCSETFTTMNVTKSSGESIDAGGC